MAEIILPPDNNDDPDFGDHGRHQRPAREFKEPSRPDRLLPGEGLRKRQNLTSPNGRVTINLQDDSNFVLYVSGSPRWVYKPRRTQYCDNIVMQEDGNLVIERDDRDVVWASETHEQTNRQPATFIVKDDGTAIIEAQDGNVIWSTAMRGSENGRPN